MVSYSQVYIPGDRLVQCEICGFDYRFSQMRKSNAEGWENLIACPKCYDEKHPLDFKVKLRKKHKLPEVK